MPLFEEELDIVDALLRLATERLRLDDGRVVLLSIASTAEAELSQGTGRADHTPSDGSRASLGRLHYVPRT